MDRGVYVVASGGINQNRNLEIISSNLAGSSVPGFKKGLPLFSVHQPPVINPQIATGNAPFTRVFSTIRDTAIDFSQGILKSTGNPLDLAISGEGFFVVQTPDGPRYTRKGDFMVDAKGELKSGAGYPVEGKGGVITLTPGKVAIATDGTISVNGTRRDKIKVVTFTEPYPLQRIGNGMFMAVGSAANEKPTEGASIVQNHLEMSNVDAVSEMVSMINAMRTYESQMKLIKGFDDLAAKAVTLARQ